MTLRAAIPYRALHRVDLRPIPHGTYWWMRGDEFRVRRTIAWFQGAIAGLLASAVVLAAIGGLIT